MPARVEGCLQNWSLTQRPGAVSAIHSGLLMTIMSREAAADRGIATARVGGSPSWVAAGSPAAALLRTRRITYWFNGSPATRITGEKMIVSSHTPIEVAAW